MKFNLTDEELDEIHDIKADVEGKSCVLEEIVDSIIQPYCKDLDKYVLFIKDCLIVE